MDPIDRTIRRALWEVGHAEPYLGYRICMDAWARLPEEAKGDSGLPLLNTALDICLDYLELDADETLEVAGAILDCTAQRDERARRARGVCKSLRARALWHQGKRGEAWTTAGEAEVDLKAAVATVSFDSDAWGSLGGLYKRMALWADAEGDGERAAGYRAAMLEAYRTGKEQGPDAYPLLNYLEYRAITDKKLPIVRSQGEAVELERALYVRRRQFARDENAPWAAFDLARGQHYLKPNVPRLLSDLGVAVEDARRKARSAADRWMVETAVMSLRDLREAGIPLDGLEDALLLARRAVLDDAWFAGSWGPLGRPEEFLAAEMRGARQKLEALAADTRIHHDRIVEYTARAEQRWSMEDEERFQEELEQFKRDVEPAEKKQLRVLWKLFGENALAWGAAAVGVPGSDMVAKYVAEQVGGALSRR